jgi:hypothetical protein
MNSLIHPSVQLNIAATVEVEPITLECEFCRHIEKFDTESECDAAFKDGDWCEDSDRHLYCCPDHREQDHPNG